MSETPPTKDALLKVIDDLKQIYETPKLYLDNFFMDLRNEIDKQVKEGNQMTSAVTTTTNKKREASTKI